MQFKVHVLGVSSSIPAYGRHPSAQVVEHNDRLLLMDCGEGTQFKLLQLGLRMRRLDAIFISHLHGDHLYGLPGLLATLSVNNRMQPLPLFGPPGLRQYVQQVFGVSETELQYELQIQEIPWPPPPKAEPVLENNHLQVTPFALYHRLPTIGYLFREKPRRPPLLTDRAEALGVPQAYFRLLKQGNPVNLKDGRVVYPEQVLGPPPPTYSFAYCSDTDFRPEVAESIRGVTLAYHEATFTQDLESRARETLHSTAGEAAQTAREAGVKRLLLGHYSARYRNLGPLLAEARQIFPESHLALENRVYWVSPPPPDVLRKLRRQEGRPDLDAAQQEAADPEAVQQDAALQQPDADELPLPGAPSREADTDQPQPGASRPKPDNTNTP